MNADLAAMILQTCDEAKRMTTTDAAMDACHVIRAIAREPYADEQAALIVDLLRKLATISHSATVASVLTDAAGDIEDLADDLEQDRREEEQEHDAMQRRAERPLSLEQVKAMFAAKDAVKP